MLRWKYNVIIIITLLDIYFFSNSPFVFVLSLFNEVLSFLIIRVEYKQLDKLRDILPDVPFIGLTATATEKYLSLSLCLLFWEFYAKQL